MPNELNQNIISFVAHNAKVEVHRHHCFQIVVSLNAAFDCMIDGVAHADKTGFVINQNITHSCHAEGASVLVYFIDAESYHGWQLKEMLADRSFIDIEPFFTPAQRGQYFAEGNQSLPIDQLQQMADDIFDIILPTPGDPKNELLDERMVSAVNFIDARLSQNIRLDDIADLICLSPERTRHLFAQQTGSPFSQYILWKRIKHVIAAVLHDQQPLADAALAAGFADQPHFNRIFKRMFGTSPKHHLKNSRFVQFLNPLT